MGRKKLTLAEKLNNKTNRVRQKQALAARKARDEAEAKLNLEAEALANEVIAELPKKMEKAAAQGHSSIMVFSTYYGHFNSVQSKAMYKISQWAKANGMETDHSSHGPMGSDDYSSGSESFYIRWATRDRTV